MSLAFSFQLTPRQTEMLLICAYGHYKQISDINANLLPDYESSWFVATGRKLMSKGLLSHQSDRSPTWMVTERGKALAAMVVDDAKRIVALADTAKPLPTPKKVKR